jgi:hypothetical protein
MKNALKTNAAIVRRSRHCITLAAAIFFSGAIFSQSAIAAPPGCAGDYNSDGVCTDARDYVTFRKNAGTNRALPNDNGLGVPIQAAHYNLWRSNFGRIAGTGTGLSSAAATPEPTSIVLTAVGVLGGSTLTARRRCASVRSH